MAYAAVISLKRTIESLTNPQILQSAYEELKLLGDLFNRLEGNSNNFNRGVTNELDAGIRDAVWKLEDELQFWALHHSLPPPDGVGAVHPTDEGVEQEIDSFLKAVKKFRERYNRELDSPPQGEEDGHVSPMDGVGGEKSTMVGLSDQLEKIREKLLDWQPNLKTISLFGMAGIGKTHLAREVYQLPLTIEHFRLRLWVKLGPKHDIENALMDIADQIERELGDQCLKKNDAMSLGEHVYKNLYGRRYLIVLDDIWSRQAWDGLKMWFPAQKNGSRLLLTTRLEEVAKYPTKPNLDVHEMRFLETEESWNLFRQNVFGEKRRPSDLIEKAGRKIAECCEGLPLLILKVADLLSGAEMDPEYWDEVANKKKSAIFADAYSEISEVLLLSFDYLPPYLKACFLYIGAFPLNYEVPLSKLINLWAVEDLVEPNMSQSIEDFALGCVEQLVSQSLVTVSRHRSNGSIRAYMLHSTYWHLCVVEARKNKFLHVLDCPTDGLDESIASQRRLSVQNNALFGIKEVSDSMAAAFTARSLLCTGRYLPYPVPMCFDLMLLKVFDALSIRFYDFPDEVLNLSRLKYLALTHSGNLPCSISMLQNLQSLIVHQHQNIKFRRDSGFLPNEIWDMQELRHLQVMGSTLPDPSDDAQLPKLLTLHVKGQSCTENVFRSISKLKKLRITIELLPRSAEVLSCFEHISILQELESLKCVVLNPRPRSQVVAPPDAFPTSLKKLSLNGLGYSWECMSAIGSLPSLEVLKLRRYAFRGPKWDTKGDEFPMLKFLLLEEIDLVHWTTEDYDCFPSIQRLIIRHCYKLKEIPPNIADLSILERIELFDSPLVVASAHKIKIEEEENGNCSLQVPVISTWEL